MKKRLIITLFLLQSCMLYGQIEFTSPDGKKRVEIHKTTDKKYQVIVDSVQHKPYRKIMKNKIYYFTDSCRVAYIALCDDGYCVVIDGIEQPHYKEIYNTTLTFSPDRSHYGYMVIFRGLFSTKTCCVIDGEEQPTYDNFASFGITFSPDSKHWAYAALHDKEWFYIIDGVAQLHYNQISAKKIVFSQDSQHWVYGAQKDNKWFYVIDGKEQPSYSYNSIDLTSFTFSSDSKHWAYIANINKEWACVLDGKITPYEESSLCREIRKKKEASDIQWGVDIGLNMQYSGGFKIKTDEIVGDADIAGGIGYKGYIGLYGYLPDVNRAAAMEIGYSNYKTPVTLNNVSKEFNVNTFYWDLKGYLPVKGKLQPYWYLGIAWTVLDIDLGEFYYTVQEGNTTYNNNFIADSKYYIIQANIGFGYKFYFLPNICFQGSISLAYLKGKAAKYSYGSGGGLPTAFNTFNEYYDFGFEIIL